MLFSKIATLFAANKKDITRDQRDAKHARASFVVSLGLTLAMVAASLFTPINADARMKEGYGPRGYPEMTDSNSNVTPDYRYEHPNGQGFYITSSPNVRPKTENDRRRERELQRHRMMPPQQFDNRFGGSGYVPPGYNGYPQGGNGYIERDYSGNSGPWGSGGTARRDAVPTPQDPLGVRNMAPAQQAPQPGQSSGGW